MNINQGQSAKTNGLRSRALPLPRQIETGKTEHRHDDADWPVHGILGAPSSMEREIIVERTRAVPSALAPAEPVQTARAWV
jgi:hypothetical protein